MPVTLVQAVTMALARAMEQDDRVLLLGQDIGVNGGVFRATDGLLKKFGDRRVLDTPISESAIVGSSIGMAARGLCPVAEIQFMGFLYGTTPPFNWCNFNWIISALILLPYLNGFSIVLNSDDPFLANQLVFTIYTRGSSMQRSTIFKFDECRKYWRILDKMQVIIVSFSIVKFA